MQKKKQTKKLKSNKFYNHRAFPVFIVAFVAVGIFFTISSFALTYSPNQPGKDIYGCPNTVSSRPLLRRGDEGPCVKRLQADLKYYNRTWCPSYYSGSVGGYFGDGTYNAVVAFQKLHNISRDGVIGSQTWATLWYFCESSQY